MLKILWTQYYTGYIPSVIMRNARYITSKNIVIVTHIYIYVYYFLFEKFM